MEYTLEHGAAADTGHASREVISNPPMQPAVREAVVEDIAPRLRARTERRTQGRPAPSAASLCWPKRAMDVAIAGGVLIFTSPLLVLIALLIRLQDGGPVVFRHERIGRDGRRFGCLKFRTMHTDADARLKRHLAENPEAAAEWAADQKLRNDPRVIGFIGRFLRTTSLDELPQIVNILRGEMSVVGPRPIVEAEIERYAPYFRYYASVRPGVTGLWQVSGRNDLSYPKRVRLDALYARKWSIGFDLMILLKTIPAVLLRRGAY